MPYAALFQQVKPIDEMNFLWRAFYIQKSNFGTTSIMVI